MDGEKVSVLDKEISRNMQSINKNPETNSVKTSDSYIRPEEPIGWKLWKRKRYIVVVMSALGLFNAYTLRTNLSVGIVAMTQYRPVQLENGTIAMEREFPWNSVQRGLILSSFFFGYLLTNFLGGYLGYRFGGTRVFGFGIGMTALLTLLTPIAASCGIETLIVLRVFEGLLEGISFPAVFDMLKHWAPPNERSLMMSGTYVGVQIGTIFSMIFSGVIAEFLGWRSIFYFFGSIGVIWYIIYLIIIGESPAVDKFISSDERRYIHESLENVVAKNKFSVPWKCIMTSAPFYAICIATFTEFWGMYTILSQLPSFLRDVMKLKVGKSGILASVPYIIMACMLFFSGWLADYLLSKRYLPKSQLRRLFTYIAFLGQGVFLIVASYIMYPGGCIAAMCFAVGLGAFALNGFGISLLEMAPHYASILCGITTTIGTASAATVPIVAGFLTQNGTPEEWRTVFFIVAGVYVVGAFSFGMWGTAELQPWAIVTNDDNTETKSDKV